MMTFTEGERQRWREEAQQQAEANGGYWCRDGEHYTFNWQGALSHTCCNGCEAAVSAYCDRWIG
jgi:hypothetical protein